ncbi:uncharacterized protein LOC106090044 [Stomoxys calcitrans]|uniref:uncharacterized protein LOC106090044 n=1 Tax=Stomoxys calcitrans TaxID=35570 RepID=UPI0027E2B32F|nr:uncharacterized protein LOC106090044 [Stomoxys calcitrans]
MISLTKPSSSKGVFLFTLVFGLSCQVAYTKAVMTIKDDIQKLNEKYKLQMNVVIDLKGNQSMDLMENLGDLNVPKILISQPEAAKHNLYKLFNMQMLAIVQLDMTNLNLTLTIMEKLLWRRHFSKIIIQFKGDETLDVNKDLLYLFHRCWLQGHTSVLVYWRNTTYTYTPYPSIQVQLLHSFGDFTEQQQQDFQQFEFFIPFIELPPRCFSYYNRKGQLIRSGIYYKIVQNFITHYNGSIRHEFFDPWSTSLNRETTNDLVTHKGYRFITTLLARNENYESSDAFHFGKFYFMVPAGKEIKQSLYLFLSFHPHMWLMIAILLAILFLLLVVIDHRKHGKHEYLESFFNAFRIIIFMNDEIFPGRTFFNYMLDLLFLVIGLFLTNSYVCNLSSMYTSRIYEPGLTTLKDIERTKLRIHVHSLDYDQYMAVENMPAVVYERMFAGNNTEFYWNRQTLNFVTMFASGADIVEYLLFQQLYMRKPFAEYIPEPMNTNPSTIIIPHRSPFLEFFNRYLSYLKDSGILNKFRTDSQWDGVLGSNIHFFQDTEVNRSLSTEYLQYAFVIWLIGVSSAFIAFIGELMWFKKYGKIDQKTLKKTVRGAHPDKRIQFTN